jgi:hypothetical protein
VGTGRSGEEDSVGCGAGEGEEGLEFVWGLEDGWGCGKGMSGGRTKGGRRFDPIFTE